MSEMKLAKAPLSTEQSDPRPKKPTATIGNGATDRQVANHYSAHARLLEDYEFQKVKADELVRRYGELEQQKDELRTVLERYMFAYPAFRMKPVGAPGSAVRVESERLMELEETAQKVLSGRKP